MSVELQRRRFTVDDFLAMAEAGILGEDDRVELIDGDIIEMSPIGSQHQACVDRLVRYCATQAGESAIVRAQGLVWISDLSLPQPDIALLRARRDFYASAHPKPVDTLLVVEVSHTTLGYDKGIKLPLYALAGIREVWIVDVDGGVIEVYRNPVGARFISERTGRRGDSIVPELLSGVSLSVDQILG